MHRALISLTGVFPLRLMYGVMSLAIPFYVAFDARGRKSSYSFFRRRMGYGCIRSALHVFSNMYNMGKVVIDRFAAYAGRQFGIEGPHRWLYQAMSPEGRYMLLSSHVGNFEMSGYMDLSPRPVKTLVYAGETDLVMQQRSRLFQTGHVEMVPVKEDLSHLFILDDALRKGEVVSVAADRTFGQSKTVRCRFFGADTGFPAGPFTLAVRREATVFAVFVVKESVRIFRLVIEPLKADGVQSLAQAYATVLERITREYPDQWFNFFDFWAQ